LTSCAGGREFVNPKDRPKSYTALQAFRHRFNSWSCDVFTIRVLVVQTFAVSCVKIQAPKGNPAILPTTAIAIERRNNKRTCSYTIPLMFNNKQENCDYQLFTSFGLTRRKNRSSGLSTTRRTL